LRKDVCVSDSLPFPAMPALGFKAWKAHALVAH